MKKKLIDYIGKPYEKYNCFDLVKDFYKGQFDIDLSDYFAGGPVPGRKEVETLIVSNKGDFVRVNEPVFGDIVVVALYGLECHVGVCIGNGQFLHSARGIGSNMDRLARYGKMISGYYRHRAKND